MSYYKIKSNDLFVNTLEAHPDVKFYIQGGVIYVNDINYISGSHSDNIIGVPRNFISLYEYNINRDKIDSSGLPHNDPNSLARCIYPFVTKDGVNTSFKSISDTEYNTQFNYEGDVISSSYFMSASITRYFITGNADITYDDGPIGTEPRTNAWAKSNGIEVLGVDSDPSKDFLRKSPYYLRALKNTINYYNYLSPHFDWDLITLSSSHQVNMITIPSIFYGSKMRKGSVDLKYYISGTLAAQATDYKQNGELVLVSGSGASWAAPVGSVVGTVLYKEGFILLTSSAPLDGNTINYESATESSWIRFGYGSNDGGTILNSTLTASYSLEFQGTNNVQTMTILAKAPQNQLNHSNNPTYLKNSSKSVTQVLSSSHQFNQQLQHVKNMVPADYTDIEPPMEKETYISKIALYDKHKNVIGYAKLATPVRKTEAREFIFKLKLDL